MVSFKSIFATYAPPLMSFDTSRHSTALSNGLLMVRRKMADENEEEKEKEEKE